MLAICRNVGLALALSVLAVGCRTARPDVKPAKGPEVLTMPPQEARFNNSVYPDMAYRDMNSQYKKTLIQADGGGVQTAGSDGLAAPSFAPVNPNRLSSGTGR
jgi:hypothetical protein